METPSSENVPPKTSIWLRGLAMIFMGLIFQVCGTILFILAVAQFLFALVSHAPNPSLTSFGRNLSVYFSQLAAYVTFATDVLPFPFSDWPSTDRSGDMQL